MFTGLHDKNKIELYEGDIVCTKWREEIVSQGVVEFSCGVFGANWDYGTNEKTMLGSWGQTHNLKTLDDDIIEKIESLGNIHQNKNLLPK